MDAIDHFGAELSKQEITDQRRVKNLMINGIVRLAQEMGQQQRDCGREWEDVSSVLQTVSVYGKKSAGGL